MTAKKRERTIHSAYAATHEAADVITNIWVENEGGRPMQLEEVQHGLTLIRAANAAWQDLERIALKVPDPKVG